MEELQHFSGGGGNKPMSSLAPSGWRHCTIKHLRNDGNRDPQTLSISLLKADDTRAHTGNGFKDSTHQRRTKEKTSLSTQHLQPTPQQYARKARVTSSALLPPSSYLSFSPSSSSCYFSLWCRMSSIIHPGKTSKSSHECEMGDNYNHHSTSNLTEENDNEKK